jgi:hypothetical protein
MLQFTDSTNGGKSGGLYAYAYTHVYDVYNVYALDSYGNDGCDSYNCSHGSRDRSNDNPSLEA